MPKDVVKRFGHDKSVGKPNTRFSDNLTPAQPHQKSQQQYNSHGNTSRKPWVPEAMDYHHQQSALNEGKAVGGYNHHNESMSTPPSRYATSHQQYDNRRDPTTEPRNAIGNNSRMMPHRHHTMASNSASSDISGNMGIHSEVVSSTPSEIALQDQYGANKEEPSADSYDNSDNDRSDRKISLSPDIQYWFDQKKKIDQLLLPLPEKGTSTSNVPKNSEKQKNGQKTQGRTNNASARVNSKLNGPILNGSPPTLQLQQLNMSGERDFNERHFTKKIFDDGGKISAKDLKEAFATFQNKHFSDGVCKFVVRLFDLDRNGGLDIKEFEQLYSYIKLWVSAYHVYDRHHAGYLTEKDFHNALKHMDIHFSPEFISFLVTRCDPINRRVSLSQFIVTCVQIQKYTDEFKNRDDNYSGTINLRYEDFLEMVLRCL